MASIRPAKVQDIPQMFDVRFAVRENRLAPGSVIPEEDVRRSIEDTGRGWVIEEDRRIWAFGIADAVNGSIWALFVHPEAEGQGYGRRLHDEMVSWLWSKGLQMIWLTTTAGTRAQMFYEHLGWQSAGSAEAGQIRLELKRGSESCV